MSQFLLCLNISLHQSNKDKPCASKCHHFCHAFDTHNFCPTCREAGKGDDPSVTFLSPCDICASFSEEQLTKITHRKWYVKKGVKIWQNDKELDLLGDHSVESFAGSQADLESAADHLFTSPPRPQPLAFDFYFIYLGFYVAFNTVEVISQWVVGRAEETSTYRSLGFCTVKCWPTASNYQLCHLRPCRGSNPGLRGGRRECYHSATVAPPLAFEALSLGTPAKTVPPTPGTALQQKLESKLEKSLGSRLDIQLDQKMGTFQANILEAMKSLREDFQKSLQNTSSQVKVDQTSASASKPGPSNTRLSFNPVESMDVDYGPALPPRLNSHASRVDASGQHISSVEEPSRLSSTKPKKPSHSHKQYDVVPSSAPDHYSDQSEDPRPVPSRAKKHTDTTKHKSRSRYLPSKPSRKTYPDQDHPQHDPDPPYYRELALSDIPSQHAEEVDTFRRILKLPDPRDSLPRSSTAVMGLDDEKGRRELRPRGPSSMLPLNSIIKDTFNKFDQDFQAATLPEGKYIKAPPSTAKWYKVGQPCYEDKIQELNTNFAKSSGAPMRKFPYQFSRNWNTKRGKIFPLLALLLPLPRLLLPPIPL